MEILDNGGRRNKDNILPAFRRYDNAEEEEDDGKPKTVKQQLQTLIDKTRVDNLGYNKPVSDDHTFSVDQIKNDPGRFTLITFSVVFPDRPEHWENLLLQPADEGERVDKAKGLRRRRPEIQNGQRVHADLQDLRSDSYGTAEDYRLGSCGQMGGGQARRGLFQIKRSQG